LRQGEIRALTGLRGIAAIQVMVYHFEWSVPVTGPLTAFLNHGYLCVDLFFILSGFVMATVYGHWSEPGWTWAKYHTFLAHRIARIYPLYVFLLGGIVIGFAAGLMRYPPAPTPRLLLTNLLLIQSLTRDQSINDPTWSISTEWVVYIIFPALLAVTNRGRPVRALGLALLCFAIIGGILALSWSGSFGTRHRGTLDVAGSPPALFRCFAGFTLGLLMWRASKYPRVRNLMGGRWIATGVAASALGLLFVPQGDAALYLLLPPLVLALGVGEGRVVNLLGCRPIHFLGVLSYGIYLLHSCAQGIWNHLVHIGPRLGEIVHHLIATTVTSGLVIGLAWICYVTIEVRARRAVRLALEPRSTMSEVAGQIRTAR
jgi:peptidoglycan/LPS O-acetylase OafA/YrhL